MNPLTAKDPYVRNATVRGLIESEYAEHEEALHTTAEDVAVGRLQEEVDKMPYDDVLKLTTRPVIELALRHGVAFYQVMQTLRARLERLQK